MQIERFARFALAGLSFAYALSSAVRAQAACGDGAREEPVESCDDGNTAPGDGCSASCQTEGGYVCNDVPDDQTTADLCCFQEVAAAYALSGNASLNQDTGEVTLVPEMTNQVGVAWFRQTLDFTSPFTISLRIYLGDRDVMPTANAAGGSDQGADGGSILFQRSPLGLAARGLPGERLGSGGDLAGHPLLGVEFDTYNNSSASRNDSTMGDEDHVSVFHSDNVTANHLAGPTCMNVESTCRNYEDGRYHVFVVEWSGNAPDQRRLRVLVDGVERINVMRDIIGSYFGGDPQGIYFGFAASTGDFINLHKFCPAAPRGYRVPRDTDGDGIDDSVDQDDDNDGRSDREETGGVFGDADPSDDHDLDGVPNFNDPDFWASRPQDCPDVVAPIGQCDSLPMSVDFDRDGIPDHLDLDSDGDGAFDAIEDGGTGVDTDGRLADCMPSMTTGLCSMPNTAPPDTDRDGAIDSRDVDSDNDGVPDASDVNRTDRCVPNAAVCGEGDLDGDGVENTPDIAPLDPCVPSPNLAVCGVADPGGDRDGDGVNNGTECPSLTSCPDTDADGAPDFNDTDSDGDGSLDRDDPARTDPCVPDMQVAACPTGDADQDGLPNGTECPNPAMCLDVDNDGVPDYRDPDLDDDQVYDGSDPAPRDPCVPNMMVGACAGGDTDRDGVPNVSDPAPLDPCIPDANALGCLGGDRDGDGLSNGFECPAQEACPDTDGDGRPDWNDADSDGDGIDDGDECEGADVCSGDADGDGLVDRIDPDRPELAGGACSVEAGPRSGSGWLLPLLLASLAGRRWRRRRAR